MADPITDFIASNGLLTAPLNLVFNVVLPAFFLAWAFGLFLAKIRLFSNSAVARYFIGSAMAIGLVFTTKIGSIGMWLGIAGVLIFKLRDWPSRVLSFVIVGIIISQIGFTLDPSALLSKAVILGFSVTALFVTMIEMRALFKVIIVLIIFVTYFFVLPYLALFHV